MASDVYASSNRHNYFKSEEQIWIFSPKILDWQSFFSNRKLFCIKPINQWRRHNQGALVFLKSLRAIITLTFDMRYEFCTNQMRSLHRCMLFYESIELFAPNAVMIERNKTLSYIWCQNTRTYVVVTCRIITMIFRLEKYEW